MRKGMIGDIEVSVIGLGCNNFGRALDFEGSRNVVHAALDAGINFFDTASNYGSGQSEGFLGQALGNRREQTVISTKFGVEIPDWEGSGGGSPEYARKVLDRSLRELGTDYIDIWMLHFPDPETPIADTLGVMSEAVTEGKVRQIGCSNFDTDQLAEALSASGDDLARFTCDQVHYSMIHREPEKALQAVCAEQGVAILPFYPLANGLLTGKTRRGSEPVGRLKMERYQSFLTDENFDVAERVEAFSLERGVPMPQVALGWLLSKPGVPSVTPGATTAAQVASNAGAAEWLPTEEDLSDLEAILS